MVPFLQCIANSMHCPSCNNSGVSNRISYLAQNSSFSNLSLLKCTSCGLLFADPMPSDSELSKYYGDYWKGEVAIVSPSTRRYYLAQSISRLRYIQKYVSLDKNTKLLDVGAGPGLVIDALNKEKLKLSYFAVEPDNVQRNALSKKSQVLGVYKELNNIPKNEKFDLIILSHVLEHVTNPHSFLSDLTELLHPEGILFIEVPNEDYRYKNIYEPHLLFFDKSSLAQTISQHGQILNISSVGKDINHLKVSTPHPSKNKIINGLKEFIKFLIALFDFNYNEKQIHKFEMDQYGENKQWLRALIRTDPNQHSE